MSKIKVLEVNNVDLAGRGFNGYDFIDSLNKNNFKVKQMVTFKSSNNPNVIDIFNCNEIYEKVYYKLIEFETLNSIHNIFSITTPLLINSKEYKEADIIHFHMFHNTKLSIPSLIRICKEKKVIITLHDPWFLTGRCVHFNKCDKWKTGCKNCPNLNTLFPFVNDNCNSMWEIKKEVFNTIDIDIIVSSKWMYDLVKQSPITKNIKNVHLIPFGIDLSIYDKYDKEKSREELGINLKDKVVFLRAQTEFKGTEYVDKALNELKDISKLTILTCDQKGLLDKHKNKFNIIDLGNISEEMVNTCLSACDMFLSPSKGESFGFMLVKAMAMGRCVVVFDNTAMPAITNAPTCGYLVQNENYHELAKAISYLLNNDEERIYRGNLGIEYCNNNYELNTYLKHIEKTYDFVYNRKHKPVKYSEILIEDYVSSIKDKINNFLFNGKPSKIDISVINKEKLEMINLVNDLIYDNVTKHDNNKLFKLKCKIKCELKKNKLIVFLYRKVRKWKHE